MFEDMRPQADRLAGVLRFRARRTAVLDHAVEALQLTTFADRLERLALCHRDPERFHVDKDALVSDLRRAAREHELLGAVGRALAPRPERSEVRLGVVMTDGRLVPVERRFRRSGKAE